MLKKVKMIDINAISLKYELNKVKNDFEGVL